MKPPPNTSEFPDTRWSLVLTAAGREGGDGRAGAAIVLDMETTPTLSPADRERRLALARQAFHDFRAQCFWFWKADPDINEATIPLIVEDLRLHGGHRGYRVAAEPCRWVFSRRRFCVCSPQIAVPRVLCPELRC